VKTMKKTHATKSRANKVNDMLPEYHFDYRKARPNRFIERIDKSRRVIILDSDVSKIFENSESVNSVLRALIAAMPKSVEAKTSRKPLRE
jgi:transposase-like protein